MAITSIGNQGQILPPGITDEVAPRMINTDSGQSAIGAVDAKIATLGAQKSANTADQNARNGGEPDRKSLESAVDRLKNFVQSANSDVQFSIDEESGIRVVKVVDKETQEVVRQLPSKEVVEMAKALDKLQGLIFRGTA